MCVETITALLGLLKSLATTVTKCQETDAQNTAESRKAILVSFLISNTLLQL